MARIKVVLGEREREQQYRELFGKDKYIATNDSDENTTNKAEIETENSQRTQ